MELKLGISRFTKDLKSMRLAVLDSSILIYHLEDCEPYSDLTQVLISMMGKAAIACIISTITITELLSKPYSDGDAKKAARFRSFIHMLPNVRITAPDEETADYAAYLRGTHGLRTPDALLLAAVRREKADAFMTNDRHLRRIEKEGIRIILLDEYLAK